MAGQSALNVCALQIESPKSPDALTISTNCIGNSIIRSARFGILRLSILLGVSLFLTLLISRHYCITASGRTGKNSSSDKGSRRSFGDKTLQSGSLTSRPKILFGSSSRKILRHKERVRLTDSFPLSLRRRATVEDGRIHTGVLGVEYMDFWKYTNGEGIEASLAVGNLCYSLKDDVFIMDKKDKARLIHDVASLRGINASKRIPHIQNVDEIRANDVVHWIRGLTVVSTEMSLVNETGAHFIAGSVPLLSAVSFARRGLHIDAKDISVAYRVLPTRANMRPDNAMYFDLAFAEIPKKNILSLSSFKPRQGRNIVCMKKALELDRSYAYTMRSSDDTAYLRDNIVRMQKTPMADDCSHHTAGVQKTIFILSRAVHSRRWADIRSFESTCQKVFGDSTKVVVFESLDQLGAKHCQTNSSREEHLTACSLLPSSALSAPLSDHLLFNQITFLISVHGAGNANYIYLPKGAHVVEVMPVGVQASYDMYKKLATRIGLEHFEHEETNRTFYDGYPLSKYNQTQCFRDNHCRKISKQLPVPVTTSGPHSIVPLLERARDSWISRCHMGA